MNFVIKSGAQKGTVFKVTDQEVTIGRSRSNTIAFEDKSVSGQHAKLYLDHDQVILEDCQSINGTELNGKPVTRSPLRKGDIISIGPMYIEVLGEGDERPVERPAARPEEEKKKPETKAPAKTGGGTPSWKKALAGALVMAVVGMTLWIFVFKPPAGPGEPGGAPSAGGELLNIFRVRYEKVRGSNENIFRYEFRIENNTLAIAIDDLKNNQHRKQAKPIEPRQMENIRKVVVDQEFMSLPAEIEGRARDLWDVDTLQVVSRGQAHTVRVFNRIPPGNFKEVCATLEKFGEAEMGIWAVPLPLEELKKKAEDLYQLAHKLYEERTVKADNLFQCIKACTECIWYLENIEPKPEIYGKAIHRKQVASDELDQQLKDHQWAATKATQMKDWKKAKEEWSMIMMKYTDETDRRFVEARAGSMDMDERLRPR